MKNKTRAGGTRLRRRLSMIFQRSTAGKTLGTVFDSPAIGMRRPSHTATTANRRGPSTVLAIRVGIVPGRQFVNQFDVADQPAQRAEIALDQVVAQDVVFGEGRAGRRLEGPYFIDAFARKRPQAEQVLINV